MGRCLGDVLVAQYHGAFKLLLDVLDLLRGRGLMKTECQFKTGFNQYGGNMETVKLGVSTTIPLPPTPETICVVCKETIKHGASKCIHCDSHQGWRRYLDFSSVVLALFIALISVLGTVVPIFVRFFAVNDADLQFAVQQSEYPGSIYLVVSNTGTRSGIVKTVFLQKISEPTALNLEYDFGNFDHADKNLLISAGESKIFYITLHNDPNEPQDYKIPYFLQIKYYDFALKEKIFRLNLPIQ